MKATCKALVRQTWPQLVTFAGYLVAIGMRFPRWFVLLSVLAVVAVVCIVGRQLGPGDERTHSDPFLGAVLVGSGLASIVLTLKWWIVEKEAQLAAGSLLYLAGHAEAPANPALAWTSIVTQWGSCAVFLVIALFWAIRCSRTG
ncbi:hypothetical protein [Paraburkholderia azotifigens]|uniref:Transmembrane protein n=1 Tax=Paraburkholderia azotifigens TaxID=2057004 RepID=A0ABU9QY78_9BURK|nr:hypothetical protein [Paraburkholderia azotifigens]